MTQIIKLLCPHCGSDDLSCDAVARWDGKAWVLAGLLDDTSCNNCGEDGISPREVEGGTHDL